MAGKTLIERRKGLPAAAVFTLDAWLRRRIGIFEYASDDGCIFRLERTAATKPAVLPDGTAIGKGDAVLVLHLWNEHVPAIGKEGATILWARQLSLAVDHSLRALALYLDGHPEHDDVAAIYADLSLASIASIDQVARIARRFGFHAMPAERFRPWRLHLLGKNMLMLMLAAAVNPQAARVSTLGRDFLAGYLSRRALCDHYIGIRASEANKMPGHAGRR